MTGPIETVELLDFVVTAEPVAELVTLVDFTLVDEEVDEDLTTPLLAGLVVTAEPVEKVEEPEVLTTVVDEEVDDDPVTGPIETLELTGLDEEVTPVETMVELVVLLVEAGVVPDAGTLFVEELTPEDAMLLLVETGVVPDAGMLFVEEVIPEDTTLFVEELIPEDTTLFVDVLIPEDTTVLLVDTKPVEAGLLELLTLEVVLVFWPEIAPGTVRVSSQKPVNRTQVQSTYVKPVQSLCLSHFLAHSWAEPATIVLLATDGTTLPTRWVSQEML